MKNTPAIYTIIDNNKENVPYNTRRSLIFYHLNNVRQTVQFYYLAYCLHFAQ